MVFVLVYISSAKTFVFDSLLFVFQIDMLLLSWGNDKNELVSLGVDVVY